MAPVAASATNASRKPPMPARRASQASDVQDAAANCPRMASAAHQGGYVRERKNSISGSSVAESVGNQGSTTTSTASTKALRSSFIQDKIDVVCRGCHELLLATAPASLGSLEDEKAFYQKAVVNMFNEVFDKAELGLARRVQEAEHTVDLAQTEQEARNATRATAELELQKKKAEIEEKNEVLAKDTAALQETDASLQMAIERKNKIQAQYNALIAERESTIAAQQESLEVLKEGTWSSAREHKKHLGVLVSLFKKLGADSSLISALPSALEKKPAERGTFDGMVVGQLDEIIAKHVTAVQEEASRAAAGVHHASSGADAAIALAEAAREKHRKSSEVAAQAQAEWKGVESNLRQAIWAQKEQQRALKQTGLDLQEEQASLERIRASKTTLSQLGGGSVEPSEVQSVSEDRSSVKVASKSGGERTAVSPFAAATRDSERSASSSVVAMWRQASDECNVAGRAKARSGSQPVSPGRSSPGSCRGSQPGSPGQGTFAGA